MDFLQHATFSDRFREYRKRFGGRRDVFVDDGVPTKRRGRSQSQSERRFGNHLQDGQSGRTTEQGGKSTGKRCGKSISVLDLLFLRISAGLRKKILFRGLWCKPAHVIGNRQLM